MKEIVEARSPPIGFEEVLTELDIGIGIPGGFTQTAKLRGVTAGDEHEPVVVAGELLASGAKVPFGPQPVQGPFAVGVASLCLMELSM